MSLQRFAAITSTNAAKILGLYPQKGVIAPASDADLVLIEPNLHKTLTLDDLHADADYSIWEGFHCLGYPVMTILRGKVIVDHGTLVGSTSDGPWSSSLVLSGTRSATIHLRDSLARGERELQQGEHMAGILQRLVQLGRA